MAGPNRRRGGWIVAGGLAGVVLSGAGSRLADRVVAHLRRLIAADDPVAAFREAPCEVRRASSETALGAEDAR